MVRGSRAFDPYHPQVAVRPPYTRSCFEIFTTSIGIYKCFRLEQINSVNYYFVIPIYAINLCYHFAMLNSSLCTVSSVVCTWMQVSIGVFMKMLETNVHICTHSYDNSQLGHPKPPLQADIYHCPHRFVSAKTLQPFLIQSSPKTWLTCLECKHMSIKVIKCYRARVWGQWFTLPVGVLF